MEHLILVALATALFVVLRFRVHIHVTYQSPGRQGGKVSAIAASRPKRQQRAGEISGEVSPPQLASASKEQIAELASALVNLGCKRQRAREIASRALELAPEADFDALLKWAIREAA